MESKKLIAICIPCFNEEKNLKELYRRICQSLENNDEYEYSIVFGDNCSTDGTLSLIKEIAAKDNRVGFINNISNFGFVRSSANILLAPDADANIFLMSDLQDPPELIPDLIREWEEKDSLVVFATRRDSRENKLLFICKNIYYKILSWLSDYRMVRNTTGFGIYDKAVINSLRNTVDSYPFIKGLVCAIGFKWSTIPYISSSRKTGESKASISFLVDFGILGIVTLSRKPMRIITMVGVTVGFISIVLSLLVTVTKLFLWNSFAFGIAMISTSSLFFTGIMLSALGIIGEYIGFINQRSLGLPLVIERERWNVPNS